MITTKYIKQIKSQVLIALLLVSSIVVTSCDFEYDLPEANSKLDETPPTASFDGSPSTTDGYLSYNFSNLSDNATDYMWDFGDGSSLSTEFEPTHVYTEAATDDLGTPYTVTLTVTDKLNAVSTFSKEIVVLKPPIPPAINPEVKHGDFEDKTGPYTWNEWKIGTWSDGNTSNPYNATSDGSPDKYDGSPSGESKTRGAKWTGSTSAGPSKSANTRYSYQALTVTPDKEYILEYSYAIKTDKDDIEGGDRVIAEILGNWFNDGVDAVANSNAGALAQAVGNKANGKGDFAISSVKFTSPASGKIAIWIYAITKDELYVDNVKVYPVD